MVNILAILNSTKLRGKGKRKYIFALRDEKKQLYELYELL